MGIASFWRCVGFAPILLLCATVQSLASPWAEVGDNALRADIEILAGAGVIDDVTDQWPLPWAAIAPRLSAQSLAGEPAMVRAAAARVLARAGAETAPGLSAGLSLDGATTPSLVYGFDGLGRGDGQAQASLSFNAGGTAGRLSLGAYAPDFTGRGLKLMPDNSFIAQKIGDVAVYAGYLSHWWGPGWISALSLSNNARPMPQIGIQRASSAASSWPVLSWLGPWQAEFFLGLLDGPRLQKNTYYNALHVSFSPLPGLEIGLARTEEFCGQGHPCVPLRDYFDLNNDPAHVNKTNDEGLIDIKYSHVLGGVPAQIYMSLMNEDSSPFTSSGTSHLFGASVFVPTRGNPVRLTAEYTDSVPTANIFSFGDVIHGFAYNNGTYLDGMRYRGRTLGFSLDSDSRLLTLQGAWSDAGGRFYELSFHHAAVSNPNNLWFNAVTTAPVLINMGEARITIPARRFKLDLAARIADDQPRPYKGFQASFEAAVRIGL